MENIIVAGLLFSLMTVALLKPTKKAFCDPQYEKRSKSKICVSSDLGNTGFKKVCCEGDAWLNARYLDSNVKEKNRLRVTAVFDMVTAIREYGKGRSKLLTCWTSNLRRFMFNKDGSKMFSIYIPTDVFENLPDEKIVPANGEAKKIKVATRKYGRRCFLVSKDQAYLKNPSDLKDEIIKIGIDADLDRHYINHNGKVKENVMFELNGIDNVNDDDDDDDDDDDEEAT